MTWELLVRLFKTLLLRICLFLFHLNSRITSQPFTSYVYFIFPLCYDKVSVGVFFTAVDRYLERHVLSSMPVSVTYSHFDRPRNKPLIVQFISVPQSTCVALDGESRCDR